MSRKRMTHSEAMAVVVNAALGYCEGSGVGLRSVPSEEEKVRIVRAVERLWPETGYQFPLDRHFLARYGVSPSPAPGTRAE